MFLKSVLNPIKYHVDCYIATYQFNIYDVIILTNTIAYNATDEKVLYFCPHFPNYHGSVKNVGLRVIYYDYQMRQVGCDFLRGGVVAISLFNAWKSAGMPKAQKIQRVPSYEKMMLDCIRRKKHGSGGVRLSAKSDEYTTDSLHYKQVTESAYWANLSDSKSGNASVVASNIR